MDYSKMSADQRKIADLENELRETQKVLQINMAGADELEKELREIRKILQVKMADAVACIIHDNQKTVIHDNQKTVVNDKVIEAVCGDLRQRSEIGLKKYGVSLERKDLALVQWLEHAYMEALDLANYLKRSIMDIRGEL